MANAAFIARGRHVDEVGDAAGLALDDDVIGFAGTPRTAGAAGDTARQATRIARHYGPNEKKFCSGSLLAVHTPLPGRTQCPAQESRDQRQARPVTVSYKEAS